MPELPIPLFSVSSSLKQGGVFTVEKAGAAKKSGRVKGPVSLCDIAKEHNLKQLHIVASNWVDFMVGHKNLKEVGCQLVFGLKLVVCENMADKSDASLKTESKVVIWMNGDGAADYQALINIVSVAANSALKGVAGMAAYCASKDAVIRITEAMAAELKDKGINVNCVLPSVIDTPENRAAMPDANPGRWVSPDALAEVIAFLASDGARAINGAAIPVVGRG